MIVKTIDSPVFYRKKRNALPAKGVERKHHPDKSFDQFLIEAFGGEVVQKNKEYSPELSFLSRENLIRLSKV